LLESGSTGSRRWLWEADSPVGNAMRGSTARRRKMVVAACAAIALWIMLAWVNGPFRYGSVCDRCGALRSTTEWRLPFTELTVFVHATESDTPLSRVLMTNGIVSLHAHHWLFGHGSGNGVKCAIGPGRHVSPTASSEDFATLVLMLHRSGEIALRDQVLSGALDPGTSRTVRCLAVDAPPATASAEELQAWFVEQLVSVKESLPDEPRR
jgi:hypothetical protein